MHIKLSSFRSQIEGSADYLISRRDPNNYGWGLNIEKGYQASSIVNTTEALFVINRAKREINNLDKTIEFLKNAIKKHPQERGNNLRYFTFGVWGLLEAGLAQSDPLVLETVKLIEDRSVEGKGWTDDYGDKKIRIWPTFQSLWVISKVFGVEYMTIKFHNCLAYLLDLGRTNSYGWGFVAGEKESLTATSYALILLSIAYPGSPDTIETHKHLVFMLKNAMDKNQPLEVEPIAGTDWHHYACCWALKALYSSPHSPLDIDTIKITTRVLEYISTLFREGRGYVEPGKQICNVRSIYNNVLAIDAVMQNFDPFNYIQIERLLDKEGGQVKVDANKTKIFIVHGQDTSTLTQLENTIWRIGGKPMIFSKLPKGGSKTVIELLEIYLKEADAVICLLTPDDEGHKAMTHEALEPRARENVLIEAGCAVINRRERALLVALGGVCIPSDFEGIHRVQFREWSNETAIAVAKRIADMGFNVDVAKAT